MSLWNPTREERDAFNRQSFLSGDMAETIRLMFRPFQPDTPELSYDPMFQASMDVMWHNYLKYYEKSEVNGREVWTRKHETSTKPV